ncbi:solute carrier family 2, facilitated glucose transporter member 1a [Callorhinchus milii]|uniref:solute carrier family 2, facilitated glucose transporter member 1a n=1 Tax=Callorhinchus milii TaxID=7868 RepID=UPI001C3F89DF|nr:solute carrier family 2, facilitated glucose transporter member 1a [Callorhinchus milii]
MAITQVLEHFAEVKKGLTVVLVSATLISAFGSSFQYGYNVAVVNPPSKFMQSFYNQTYIDRNNQPMNENLLTVSWSLTVSLFPLGGLFGSLLIVPLLVDKLGRKGILLVNNIFSIVPAILMGTSKQSKSFEIIMISRFIVGLCAGVAANVVPMYVGEIAPKRLRGGIGVVPQLFITIGILFAQILGLRFLLANDDGWPLMLAMTGIPAILQVILLPLLPESPRFLLIQKGSVDKARAALQRLRGYDNVENEIEEMQLEDQSEKADGLLTVKNLFTLKALRWQLITVIMLNMGQQLSGVNAIYYYADSIFRTAGVYENSIQFITVGTGTINVIMTIAAIFIVDAAGRKILLLIGFAICGLFSAVLTVALKLQNMIHWMPAISILSIIVYIIGHAIGPSPIPYVVTTELFRQSSRPAAFMVAGSVHWFCNFLVGIIFPFLVQGFGPYCFVIFSSICFLTFAYIFIFVPETKNKTFQEISQTMAKRNKVEVEEELDMSQAEVKEKQ